MNFTLQRSGADTGGGGPGGLDPPFRATFLIPPLNLLEQRYLKLSVWFGT